MKMHVIYTKHTVLFTSPNTNLGLRTSVTKIHLLLENQFNLLGKSTYLGMFNHSETPVIYLMYFYTYKTMS